MVRLGLLCWLLLHTILAQAIKPVATYWAKPDTLGLNYEDLTLTTPDQVHLAAWLVAPVAGAPAQHTTMVLAGADAGNMSSFLYQARALAAAGYQVLLFDYRGFGHSDAFAIDQNRLYYEEFALDLGTALAAARRRAPRQRVGIISYSMGTLLGAKVAAAHPCDFLITDSYVASPQRVVAYYQRVRPERPLSLPAEAVSYAQVAPCITCPWLLIVGDADPVTTLHDSLATAKAARRGQRRQVFSVAAGHMGALAELAKAEPEQDYGNAYVRIVSRFLAGKLPAVKN